VFSEDPSFYFGKPPFAHKPIFAKALVKIAML